jgi:hypothetical protein
MKPGSTELFRKLSKKYRTPFQVQKLLRTLKYNRDNTIQSALSTWKSKKAHCLEGVLLAAAILEHRCYPPIIVSIESQDCLDHVLLVFKEKTGWGSVGRSRDDGLHGRQPLFQNLQTLVKSYFDPYVDHSGRITGFTDAHLDDTGCNWRNSTRNLWKIETYLNSLKHRKLHMPDSRYKKMFDQYQKTRAHEKQKYWW